MQDLRRVGAVLLPINCGKGNGLAVEAHLVIIALSDLILPCRPRCLDILEQDHSLHAADGLLGLLLRAYGSRPSRPIYHASITPAPICTYLRARRPVFENDTSVPPISTPDGFFFFAPGPCIPIFLGHVAIGLTCSSATSHPLLW